MPRFTSSVTLPVSVDGLEQWFSRQGALERMTPPWMHVSLEERHGRVAPGDWVRVRIPTVGPVRVPWTVVHEALPEGQRGFADVQQSGPFASWRHEHRFRADGVEGSVLEDDISYELPLGGAGSLVAGGKVQNTLERMFAGRHQRLQHDLQLHQRAGFDHPLRIAVTGASGLVGSRLVAFLRTGGHEVHSLVRKPEAGPGEIRWDPAGGEIDATALEDLDAVVHLAGASIAGGLWTESRKKTIRQSRIDGTRLLATTLAGLTSPPGVFVSTSAVGYYGDGGETVLNESAPMGEGFLAEVCRDWEAAADPAREAGIRVVHPRFGVVFAGEGGMLPLLARVFRLGGGGRLGDGEQYLSWIAADDLLGVLLECIARTELSGPVNAVSPGVVSNAEFTRVMGRVLHRPTLIPVPKVAMQTVAGQLADELILVSQRAVPQRLEETGFPFAFPTLGGALRFELGKG